MNELVSRQAAIKAIDDLPNCYNGYSDTYDKSYIIGVLEELPTAEPKKGKWTDHTCINWHGYHCSVCDYETQRATNYCPNCGARMERSEDADC